MAGKQPSESRKRRAAGGPGDYLPGDIEPKWQARWRDSGIDRSVDSQPGRQNWFALTMYPYPSGDVHIGHWFAFAPADAHARFKRMQGYNVLHPQGFDAFGLPAENAAIERNIHPRDWTLASMENMRQQFRSMGTMYDWDREVITCQPEYYRWNQLFFLKLLEAGLAYRAKAAANWCPGCQTTLANEQVKEGGCERCGTSVVRRDMEQWFFRITKYADELLDMSRIEWPEKIKLMQTNWIGRSEGVEIAFDISEYGVSQSRIPTFTTRIDTIFGVTFVVLSPEHPLVDELTQPEQRETVRAYVDQAARRTEIDRTSIEREQTGVPTGSYAVNPLNGEPVPVLVGDYVLGSYGTGAVMGVPAHDERDFGFAKRYDLEIRVVVAPPDWDGGELHEAYLEPGVQVNSGEFDGLPSEQGTERISDKIEANGWGHRTVSYRMRDWLISRQRYWGTPIPVVYCDGCGTVPVPEEQLPVLLPEEAEFRPTGQSPLTLDPEFVNTTCPECGGAARRETDTMDTFVDSSWYHLRFTSPNEDDGPFDPKAVRAWAPVHQYMGGAEHAVMHLLYARFFNKALRDLGFVEFDEPYARLFNQGVLLARHRKISKRSNPLTPDPLVGRYGADAVRCYLMFLGPWDQGGDWSDSGIRGLSRWLTRVWDLVLQEPSSANGDEAGRDLLRAAHQTTRRVIGDLDQFKFNTALAGLMEYTNEMARIRNGGGVPAKTWREAVERLLLLLAPMAPHVAEELWERTGHEFSIHLQPLPGWDDALAAEETITLAVQVNGRLRDTLEVPASVGEEQAIEAALASENVQRHVEGKNVVRRIYVPGRLVNLVVK